MTRKLMSSLVEDALEIAFIDRCWDDIEDKGYRVTVQTADTRQNESEPAEVSAPRRDR